jgi:hypothetical protein
MNSGRIQDVDGLAFLQWASRNQISMTAHEFYAIAGLLPQTVRAARLRARKRGEPDPVPMLTDGTYNIDLVAALHWLQRTGRHGCLLRLKAYFDDVALDSISVMRGVRIGSGISIVPPMPNEQSA